MRISQMVSGYDLHHVSPRLEMLFPRLTLLLWKDNYPAPNKRPLSSTSPTILEHADGSLYLVLGGSGGSRIFPSVAQVILGTDTIVAASPQEDVNELIDVSKAVEAPRAHNQLYPLLVDVDSTIDKESVDGLLVRGHNVTGE